MREIMLVQGHPYSNDDDEPWEERRTLPGWLQVLVIVAIVVAVAMHLISKHRRGE